MKSATKKISDGLYQHIATGLYISAHRGNLSTCWNIFNDRDLCDEWAIGFNTKWQAIESIDKYYIK